MMPAKILTPSLPLASFGPFGGGANLPRLPDAPFLERYFLESPLPVVGLLAVGAIAAFYFLNRGGAPRKGTAVAALLLLAAAGVYALAALVETPREHLRARNDALVDAVARTDGRAAGDILAEDVLLRAAPLLGASMPRDRILAMIDNEMRTYYSIENYRIMETQASADADNAGRTVTHVRVTPSRSGAPFFSWWRLDWRKDADGVWRVTSIEMLRTN